VNRERSNQKNQRQRDPKKEFHLLENVLKPVNGIFEISAAA
jgi:hypothetical protein